MEMIMTRFGKLLTKIAAFTVVSLTYGSAMAATFSGELPVGYSDSRFQIGGGASSLVIDIGAFGSRDPALCGSCNSIYTDNYTVNLFNQAGTLLASLNEINYLYYSMYGSSHGIGAGPVWMTVPAGATSFEVVSRLSIAGLLGSDGHPLSFGNLNISTDGSITAATPIPSTLPLMATGLAALGLFGWHRRRKGTLTTRDNQLAHSEAAATARA
jgi:MYXO-CTERM domain-containing protein